MNGAINEQLHLMRTKMEECFSSLENSFLQKTVPQISQKSLKESLHPSSTISEAENRGNQVELNRATSEKIDLPNTDQEIYQLKKVIQDQGVQIQSLEETVQSLRKNLKEIETERQELLNRLHIIHY